MTVPSFIIVGYVWQILGRMGVGPFAHPLAAQKRPILNRVKEDGLINIYLENIECDDSIKQRFGHVQVHVHRKQFYMHIFNGLNI